LSRRRGADPIRILYSFPHKIGSGRIADTAWHQVAGVAAAGGDVQLETAVVHERLPPEVRVGTTLARGRWRIPYRAIGRLNAFALHDRLVARRLRRRADDVDVVHTWPLGALETLRVARELGIPSVLERPNTHTRFGYTVVKEECDRLGVQLPPNHEHAYNQTILDKEEVEYALADRLLCPSDFVLQTFVDEGFPREKLVRHFYGFDEARFHPDPDVEPSPAFTALFVGVAAVRKGVHIALEAWLASSAHEHGGKFLIAGDFLPAYREKLEPLLDHASIEVLGHRDDIPALMQRSSVLVLPSLEEGSALVTSEAAAVGCVPLVSDRSSGVCVHDENSLVHPAGDVETLARHLTSVARSPELLERLRRGCLRTAGSFTWAKAGERLLEIYREVAAGGAAGERNVAAAASGRGAPTSR
jgi:glycosyltransferase involved in cell wall biosynthesis